MQNKIKKYIFLPQSIKIYKLTNKLLFTANNQFILLVIPKEINIYREGTLLTLEFKVEDPFLNSWYFILKNIIIGLTRNFSQRLQLKGVGFKATLLKLNTMELKIGYSHSIIYQTTTGIKLDVSKNILLQVKSPLKNLVGQEASKIQYLRYPDIYKGKGILYKGEKLNLKIGKKA